MSRRHNRKIMARVVKITIVLLVLFMVSCSPQKRVARLISKYNMEQLDTNIVRDTTITLFQPVDTTFMTNPIDTIVIFKNRVKTVVHRFHDTLKIYQHVLPDTSVTETMYIYRTTIVEVQPKWIHKAKRILFVVGGLLILSFLGFIAWRIAGLR